MSTATRAPGAEVGSEVGSDVEEVRDAIRASGFWFVDVPRTGSTSLRVELGRAFGSAHGKRNTADPDLAGPQLLTDHVPARQVRALLGPSTWSRLFTFAIVRDPWTRTASMFRWRRREGSIPPGLTFAGYVEALARGDRELFAYAPHSASCSTYVTGGSGERLVSYVGRFDRREEAVGVIASQLGVALGEVHTQHGDDAATPWTRRTVDLVAARYADDVRAFGFRPEEVLR